MKKIELLAPAGNMEKMKMAILYGADAVYLAGKGFGLRAYGGNFDNEERKRQCHCTSADRGISCIVSGAGNLI